MITHDVRFGALQETLVNRAAYKVGTRMFTLPETIGRRTDQFIASHKTGNPANRLFMGSVKWVGNFFKKYVTDLDYREVTDIGIGKRKLTAPRPPLGAMALLLYPGTILPRALRAYQRGKDNNGDYREVYDVIRRDGITITLILFLLERSLYFLNKIKQKIDGLEIVDRLKRHMLTYQQFDNYKLVNKQVLIRMLEEGNGKGLLKSAKVMLNDRGLSKAGNLELQKHVDALNHLYPELVAAHNRNDITARNLLAEQIIVHVKQADQLTSEALEKAKLGGTASVVKQLEKAQGSFERMVTQYAKTRRLPVDVLGFAIVVCAMGWFPVWFNSLWNKKQFEEKHLTSTTPQSQPNRPFAPQMTFQAFQQFSSPGQTLNASNPFSPQSPLRS